MLTYLPNDPLPGGKYSFSYQQLREDYLQYVLMSDEEFMDHLLDILHFACFVLYIKETRTQWVLSDTGIVHELIHLLMEQKSNTEITTTPLSEIRSLFNRDCCLAA